MSPASLNQEPPVAVTSSIGGPVSSAWREAALTRAKELESLSNWAYRNHRSENAEGLAKGIQQHLAAAREAACQKNRLRALRTTSSVVQRAIGNLYAAEAQLLNLVPAAYILGQMPSLLNHVQRHLAADDPRRQDFERIAQTVGVKDADHLSQEAPDEQLVDKVEEERGRIITAVRGASTAALREQWRVASFRTVVVTTTLVMILLAVGVGAMGFFFPTAIPLCFQPEKAAKTVVVCPTAQSEIVLTGEEPGPAVAKIDKLVEDTANRVDLIVIELIGFIAAALAAAASIRGIRGSSEPYGLLLALAALKLPTGAITAFLGLMLMRGRFIPGLSELDTSGQILAWAIIFGYAQELFTRFVDQQAHTVLDSVRGADKDKK